MKATVASAVSAQPAVIKSATPVLTVSKTEEKPSKVETATQTILSLTTEKPVQTEPVTAEKPIVSIVTIMEKAEKLHLLTKKYDELNQKRKSLDLFEISHDQDNAQMQLADAKGLSFESSNPKCIKKVIDIWKEEFSSAIGETEKQIRSLIGA